MRAGRVITPLTPETGTFVSDLQVFQFPADGRHIRTVLRDDDPWFVAADVCAVLDIANPRDAVRSLDPDESDDHGVGTNDTLTVKVISEPGLYSLILRSRKPEAKAFKRWVIHEVLPALRRIGRYSVADVTRKDLALMVVKAEEERERAEEERDEARAQLAWAAPKAEAYNAFMDSDGTFSMEQVAKMLHRESGLGRNRLFRRLRELNVLQDSNLPYQRYAQHFHVVANSFEHSDGRRQVTYTTRVQASGVDFIRTKLGIGQVALVPLAS